MRYEQKIYIVRPKRRQDNNNSTKARQRDANIRGKQQQKLWFKQAICSYHTFVQTKKQLLIIILRKHSYVYLSMSIWDELECHSFSALRALSLFFLPLSFLPLAKSPSLLLLARCTFSSAITISQLNALTNVSLYLKNSTSHWIFLRFASVKLLLLLLLFFSIRDCTSLYYSLSNCY